MSILNEIRKFSDMSLHNATFDEIYGGRQNVELLIGMMLGNEIPELVLKLIEHQFEILRHSGTWFENMDYLTADELAVVQNITMNDIILMTTDLRNQDIFDQPFKVTNLILMKK